jgi:hypothetical protein
MHRRPDDGLGSLVHHSRPLALSLQLDLMYNSAGDREILELT